MTNYFKPSETKCKCGCGYNGVDIEFLDKLNLARAKAGIPFVINSWCRCEAHNKNIGGSKTSSHLEGCAADISARGAKQKFTIIKALIDVGFTRIGIANNYIHVDLDRSKPQKVIWTY